MGVTLMECPNCKQDMRRLVNDQIADWLCYRCNSLWTSIFMDGLTEKRLDEMHTAWLVMQAYQRERFSEPKEPKPLRISIRKGLDEFF